MSASTSKKPTSPDSPKAKTKKKKGIKEQQRELRELASPKTQAPKAEFGKMALRLVLVLVLLWVAALFVPGWIPKAIVGALTLVAVGAGLWFVRYVRKSEALTEILRDADTDAGRKEALDKLEKGFKKGDVQAIIARAQLEMQSDPRKALATLSAVEEKKLIGPMASQVRSLRAMLHLTLGELKEAREEADALDLGKQQDAKTRAMFATVAAEAWARTGQGKKAVATLELFNPDDPDLADARIQLLRARAFAYAAVQDVKATRRTLKKIADTSPQLLGMFVGAKRVHPLLEREAKQMVIKLGAAPRRMVQKRL